MPSARSVNRFFTPVAFPFTRTFTRPRDTNQRRGATDDLGDTSGGRNIDMLKAIADKAHQRATDVLIVASCLTGCVGLLAAAH
jgi:hypothetical protein